MVSMDQAQPFIRRRFTRTIQLGPLSIGGTAPVSVQSMCTTDTRNAEASLEQISGLAAAGCEIVRLAVPDETAARSLHDIVAASPLPLIADIHFDHRLAVMAVESGVAGLRINPGNIGGPAQVDRVVDAAKAHNVAIRIGVNGGSLDKKLLARFGGPTPAALVESALEHVALLEARGFYNTKISLKSSSVTDTVSAYRLMAACCDYPLHLGLTEAGTLLRGAVKSSIAMGILLAEGIGDTIRVSLTAEPVQEIPVAWEILRSLGLRQRGAELISCPTCGRCEINLIELAEQVEQRLGSITKPLRVAVMGCVVNGPGEAREADIGLAGGRDKGIIFKHGQVVRTVRGTEALLAAFLEELDAIEKDT